MIKISKATIHARATSVVPGVVAGAQRIIGTNRLYSLASMPGVLFKYHASLADIVGDCQGIAFQTWNGTTLSPNIHVAMGEHARMILERGFSPQNGSWALGSSYSDTNLEVVRNQAYIGLDNTVFDWDVYSLGATKSTRMLAPTSGAWPQSSRDFMYTAANCALRNVMGIVNDADVGYLCSNPTQPGVAHTTVSADGPNQIIGQMGSRITLGMAGAVLLREQNVFLAEAPSDIKPFMAEAIKQVSEIYKEIPLLATVATQWENVSSMPRVRSGFSLPSLCAVDRSGYPQDIFIPSQNPDRPFAATRVVTLRASEFPPAILSSTVSKHRIAETYDWPTGRILPVSSGSHAGGTFARIFKMLSEPERFTDQGLNTASYDGDPSKFTMSTSDRRPVPKEVVQWANSYYGHPMINMLQNMSQRVYDLTEQLIKESA